MTYISLWGVEKAQKTQIDKWDSRHMPAEFQVQNKAVDNSLGLQTALHETKCTPSRE